MNSSGDEPASSTSPTGAHPHPEADGLQLRLRPVDYTLFVLTVFPSLFALMFVTSTGVHFLENVRGRRLAMLGFLALELAATWLLVARALG